MPTAEEFDEFYVNTRRDLVIQTFALTGDLTASRNAVRDAYVAARHHWDKVGRSADPESWIRPRAWSAAQRRRAARPIHRERHVDSEQAATLEALHKLSDGPRRSLVLTHLTELTLPEIAREIGMTLPKLQETFESATRTVATALDCETDEVGDRLRGLASATEDVKLPRPSIVRRNGLRRRRNHAVIGSALIALTTVLAGGFVAVGAPTAAPPKAGSLVSKKQLLAAEQVANLSTKKAWELTSTDDNTQGTGINTMCQTEQFADTNGLGTLVRKFNATGSAPRSLVQTIEISSSPGAATKAYATTLGWYAGCTVARIQLVDAYTVTGVGDQAQILRMRIPGATDRSFVIALARTGALTTSTVLETRTKVPAAASALASTLASSVRNLCSSSVAGACVGTVSTRPTLPPRSGETAGMLAIADLPVIPGVRKAWSGTAATDATQNPAATTCDRANFAKSGAAKPSARSFVILKAGLPARFGLTETIGEFGTPNQAARFVDQVVARMKACPDRELGSTVTQQLVRSNKARSESFALWRLGNQVSPGQPEIMYWIGISRAGNKVSQLLLTPVRKYDVDQLTFATVLERARDRLYELDR